jgi:hypothetical protein
MRWYRTVSTCSQSRKQQLCACIRQVQNAQPAPEHARHAVCATYSPADEAHVCLQPITSTPVRLTTNHAHAAPHGARCGAMCTATTMSACCWFCCLAEAAHAWQVRSTLVAAALVKPCCSASPSRRMAAWRHADGYLLRQRPPGLSVRLYASRPLAHACRLDAQQQQQQAVAA